MCHRTCEKLGGRWRILIDDLKNNAILRFRHRFYLILTPVMAFLDPGLVAHYDRNDLRGGIFIASSCRLFLVHHSTSCVNSVAHCCLEHSHDDERTLHDSIITAFPTLGEDLHNFHHEFSHE